jgi:hypothetical protein
LLAPQRDLIATGESKSKNKSESFAMLSALQQYRQLEADILP